MSLRARLLAVLLGVAAVGLIAAGAVTYGVTRESLLERTDDQALAAVMSMERILAQPAGGAGPPPRPPRDFPEGHGDGGRDGPPRGRGRRGSPQALPPGTYAERRDSSGRVVRSLGHSFGERPLPPPRLPRDIPAGESPERPELLTVSSTTEEEVRYRVAAVRRPGGAGTDLVAIPLREVDRTLGGLLRAEVLVIASVLAVLAGLAWWLVRIGLRPLERIADTAGAIAQGDLSRRVSPATERTEVGRLGLALNAMLGQIERAFAERQASEDRLRRFLADASHELRTPLSSIRGYAELFRIGAARKPDDTEKAMRRIESEAARMGALVEDLLALARLDELREPAREPVDLAQVAREAAEDARAAAPERSIELDADGSVTVLGDAHQLRQVLANLMRNALVHTPTGTPIELRVARDGVDARLEVRDHGPGLPTADSEAIFGRFWRADPGRGRGRAGAGLGLAIVSGVVSAHGGRVVAADADGGGASFVVWLPAHGPAPTLAPPPSASTPASALSARER